MTSMKAGRALAIRKFIKCIQIHTLQDENSVICVKALCAAAASKNVDYIPKIMMDGTGRNLQAHCTCPAGSGWSAACKHIAALVFNIEHYSLCCETMELISKTSKPQVCMCIFLKVLCATCY